MESQIFERVKSEKENKYFFVKAVRISPLAMGYYPALTAAEAIEKLGREFNLLKKDLVEAEVKEISKDEFASAAGQRYGMMMRQRGKK